MKSPNIPKLVTSSTIAEELDVPVHRVRRILETRPHIQPRAMAGKTRLYDRATIEAVRSELIGQVAVLTWAGPIDRLRLVVVERGAAALRDGRAEDFEEVFTALNALEKIATDLPGIEHINAIGFLQQVFRYEKMRPADGKATEPAQLLTVANFILRAMGEHAAGAGEVQDG